MEKTTKKTWGYSLAIAYFTFTSSFILGVMIHRIMGWHGNGVEVLLTGLAPVATVLLLRARYKSFIKNNK